VLTDRNSGYGNRDRITVMILGFSDPFFRLWSVLINLEDLMYLELAPAEAQEAISHEEVTLVDIRDPESFQAAHLVDAVHINDANIHEFLETANRQQPLIVYCYHGISSAGAASFFSEQGFEKVSHIEGGFEAWQQSGLPTCSG
jgi:thiosulfate sulfurtransferase